MKPLFTILLFLSTISSWAQDANDHIIKGNEWYKRNDLKQAEAEYVKALQSDEKNIAAQFNYANTLHREGKFIDAARQFDAVIKNTTDNTLLAKAFYNRGVAQVKQHLLPEAIESFKQSLRYDPVDQQARENLQKALNEMQQQQKQKPQDKKKPDNKPQDNRQNKQQLDKELDQLREEEKRLQQQLQQQKVKQVNPSKDW